MLQLNTQWFFLPIFVEHYEKYLCRFTWIGTLPKVAALKDAGYEPFIVEAGTYSEIRPFFFCGHGCWGLLGGALSCKIIFGGHP